ncbi:putative tRNA-specific adenosine deaminase [Podospora australis]|uniref:tRNA-specific adenosine deaminase n=1 Tax=Podospora australis TaxID=1536484 RepID=A0AAN6X3C2_9PEZI|nr:putative tRNA-specific adenosine deaminase [Podospora australis]
MVSDADAIAAVVLEEFRKLPAKRKPAVRDNGLHEWVPLSGIVAKGSNFLKCVALATGMKCLPASKLSQANGVAIHDWHAEVLALRCFNRFLLDECNRLAQDSNAQSEFIIRNSSQKQFPPFTWRREVTLHMYCSEAPCGDASMELTMAAQTDSSPWESPPAASIPSSNPATSSPEPTPLPESTVTLLGRGYFSHLGIVRRKPARGDAPPTMSKSCSDKIALKQCTSLLSSLTSLFVSPSHVYLSSLVLPESQYSATGCTRCFGFDADSAPSKGRMSSLLHKSWDGYKATPFNVVTTEQEFDYSKKIITERTSSTDKIAASNLAKKQKTGGGVEEGLIGGVLQGRKSFDIKGASAVSRRKMWALALEVAQALAAAEREEEEQQVRGGMDLLLSEQGLGAGTYDGVKDGDLMRERRQVKDDVRREALKGWLRNTGDGGFSPTSS